MVGTVRLGEAYDFRIGSIVRWELELQEAIDEAAIHARRTDYQDGYCRREEYLHFSVPKHLQEFQTDK